MEQNGTLCHFSPPYAYRPRRSMKLCLPGVFLADCRAHATDVVNGKILMKCVQDASFSRSLDSIDGPSLLALEAFVRGFGLTCALFPGTSCNVTFLQARYLTCQRDT
jgi:hypothetical protein